MQLSNQQLQMLETVSYAETNQWANEKLSNRINEDMFGNVGLTIEELRIFGLIESGKEIRFQLTKKGKSIQSQIRVY